jgi:hypothetical protein
MPTREEIGGGPLQFAGPVRLISGENSASYDELLARVTNTIKPGDIIEEMWVRDLVDLLWEVLRLRRLKASFLVGRAYEGLQKTLFAMGADNAFELSRSWAAREPETVASVEQALATAGFSTDTIMAVTLSERIDEIERIERMTIAAEARRNEALERIEGYRGDFGKRLRGTVHAVEADEIKAIAGIDSPAAGSA